MRRSMPVVFSVTFVRHGETIANKEHRIQGHLDIPLNAIGEKQAALAGKNLSKQSYSRVYASDLKRAYSTCKLILDNNTCHPPEIKIDTKLRERNFGTVEGLLLDEVKSMAAAEGLNYPQYNPPGAETLGNVQERMVSFFKELCQSVYDKNNIANGEGGEGESQSNGDLPAASDAVENILVVSHGAALKQLYNHIHKTLGCSLSEKTETLNRISPNTGISEYIIRFTPKNYGVHCVRFHDDQHLQSLS